MPEALSIKDMPNELRVKLLKEIGLDSDGKYVLDKDGNRVSDKYINEPVQIDNMFIYPTDEGPLVLDNNALSIVSLLEEYEIDL